MKNKAIAILLACVMFATTGCSVTVTVDDNQGSVEDAAAYDEADEVTDPSENDDTTAELTSGGSPWIDSDIRSNVTEDMPTDPADDFHLYANKEWILDNEIPAGYAGWSHYDERAVEVKKQCMDLLKDDSIEGRDAELIRKYNSLLLDWDARNKAGYTEIEDVYGRLLRIESIDDVNELYEDEDILRELTPFFQYQSGESINDPGLYVITIDTPALLLGDSAEYSDRTDLGDMYYGFRKDMFVYMATRMGMSETEAEKCFDDAMGFETGLADNIYTSADSMQDDFVRKINNEMVLDDLTDHCKNFPIGRILANDGYVYDGIYLVSTPDYFNRLDELYTDENIDGIRSYLIVHYLLRFTGSLDRDTYDFNNELINRYFGTSGTISDEEMAYNRVTGALPSSMQKVYISVYGSEKDKERMEELCRMVIDTYREMLSENDWASDEVKKNAIAKLDAIAIHAAYPDKFRDTPSIDFDGCSLVEAQRRIVIYNYIYDRSLFGTQKDKEMWAEGFDILSCNAFYSQSENSINMIIGMMGEPFYSGDMSTEELYASIGAFWVGHEISHAFDSGGSQFDEKGFLKNWWTDKDKEEFDKRIDKMDRYLDGIVAFGDEHFRGSNIDTEMMADMTGLQCALRMASKVDGFDYDKFFVKFAQMNGCLGLYSSELTNLSQDPHPLEYSRTNVPVQQFEEFYTTYDVKEGDNMYLAPEDRLIVW